MDTRLEAKADPTSWNAGDSAVGFAINAKYEDIRAKRYPYRFFLGLAPAVQPQPEVKMTLRNRTS